MSNVIPFPAKPERVTYAMSPVGHKTHTPWYGVADGVPSKYMLSRRLTLILWLSGPGLLFGMGPSWARPTGANTHVLFTGENPAEGDRLTVLEDQTVKFFALLVARLGQVIQERTRLIALAATEGDDRAYTREDEHAACTEAELKELFDFVSWVSDQDELRIIPSPKST